VLSLSKHERRSDAPFDKLRVNGDNLLEEHKDKRRFLGKYVFSIKDSFVNDLTEVWRISPSLLWGDFEVFPASPR
jgi:hypothetical protein